ncbi:MAG: alpha/beta hydrolase [Rhodospirillaceae bacterium]|nr:alpha/beta hydrolase [Rhodospirillaceae bacterium]
MDSEPPAFLWNGPSAAETVVLLAHGAGAPMDTPFMSFFAEGVAALGMRVGRFEFPYMAARRINGAKKPPNPAAVLLDTWRAAIAVCDAKSIIIGGKSMGGRMASMIADEMNVTGLMCLGYPFYGAGKRDKPRIAHLEHLKTRTLICQGERDALGDRPAVEAITLSPHIAVHWLPDGDHDLKPRKASGHTHEGNLNSALDAISQFLSGLAKA